MAEPKALESSLNRLTIDPQPSRASAAFAQKQNVAESWDDEELEDSGDDTDRPLSAQTPADYPSAPPPTPISPSTSFARDSTFVNQYGYGGIDAIAEARSERPSSRPEKTDAVAKRMIAGALGVRAPKKTDEQKAYEKAIKEKEIKRRNQEKEAAVRAKEEGERAKAAVWTD